MKDLQEKLEEALRSSDCEREEAKDQVNASLATYGMMIYGWYQARGIGGAEGRFMQRLK